MGAEECWGESGKIFTTWKGGRGCCFGKDVEGGGGAGSFHPRDHLVRDSLR